MRPRTVVEDMLSDLFRERLIVVLKDAPLLDQEVSSCVKGSAKDGSLGVKACCVVSMSWSLPPQPLGFASNASIASSSVNEFLEA